MLLGRVLDVDDLPLGDEFLQEQGEQALAAGEFLERTFEPVIEQDVGIDAFGFSGDVIDAGRLQVGALVGGG